MKVVSAYRTGHGKVYLITEATEEFEPTAREITTLLMADEY